MNQRGIAVNAAFTAAQDQRFMNALFDVVDNQVTGKRTVYVNKRPGFKLGSSTGSTRNGKSICDNYGFASMSGPCICHFSGVAPTTCEFYVGTTAIGSASPAVATDVAITQAVVGGEETYLITISKSAGYFIGTTGLLGNSTFTADTHTNTTIDNVSDTTGLVIGQLLSGSGITSGTRISAINGSTLTVDTATTATAATVTVTRERMSKIIASNYPTPIGPMVEMNGVVFVAQNASQNVWNSPVNSITSAWSAASFIPADDTPGHLLGVSRQRDTIFAHKYDGIQTFVNKGNATGSVLGRVPNGTKKFGTLHSSGGLLGNLASSPFSVVDDLVVIAYAGVHILGDSGLTKISNDVVDRVIFNATSSTIIVEAFNFVGRYYVLVRSGTLTDPQFLYDVANKVWHEFAHSYLVRVSKHLGFAVYATTGANDANTAAWHNWPWSGAGQTATYQDDSSSYTMTIQTSRIDHGTDKRKFVRDIRLIADNQASGTATLTASDDDFASFVTLGTFDMTAMTKRITRCGSYKGGRSYRITHSANTAFRAEALEIEYDVGTS